VRECLVFGVPSADTDRGEAIVAVVLPHRPVPVGRLKDFLLEHLPAWQVPRHWWCIGGPLTDHRGKVSRAAWRDRFLGGRDKGGS
jgi:acyl-CoA synthetase (AMP-forming)/AMP-acid ligase II